VRKLVLLGLVAVVLVVADQSARVAAEGRLASRARDAATDEDSATADITSFPFIGRLFISGSVPRVRVRVEGPRAGPLRLAAVVVDASGVVLDRGRLVRGDVRVEDIDRGSVAVEIDGAALAETLRLPVTVRDGQVRLSVGGVAVPAAAEVDDGTLVLRVGGLPAFRVPVVRTPLVPCTLATLTVTNDRVRMSCQMDELPSALRR
jgi:hypothetical protein